MDNRLQLRPPQETSLVKSKALEDARKAQAQVIEECKKKGKDPPPYVLEELIGKGSFGRVYRGFVDYLFPFSHHVHSRLTLGEQQGYEDCEYRCRQDYRYR